MTKLEKPPKLLTREEVLQLAKSWKAEGRKIGFTSGVFDLMHPGHVLSFIKMKEFCDVLIVAVNSNSSVRTNKGEDRPIVDELARAAVVAALEAVDAVYIFDELDNKTSINLIKPDIYLKSGDYSKESLSSTSIVESYGGKVEIIPFHKGFSSTAIIEKIKTIDKISVPEESVKAKSLPAIFLDRDGTIVEDVDHLHEPEKLKIIPGVVEGLKKLRNSGYRLVVCTNQAGIGLGYFTKEDFFSVSRKMLKEFSQAGVLLDKIYFSPFTDLDNSEYHKPRPGMLMRGAKELNLNIQQSYMIGDSKVDVDAAKAAGCKSIIVLTGKTKKTEAEKFNADYIATDFSQAVDFILGKTE